MGVRRVLISYSDIPAHSWSLVGPIDAIRYATYCSIYGGIQIDMVAHRGCPSFVEKTYSDYETHF